MNCVVCQREEATQKHHLTYEPQEILIDICVTCHKKIHQHGVGNGKGLRKIPQENDNINVIGTYLINKQTITNGQSCATWFDKVSGERLTWLVCNCGKHDFHVYGTDDNKQYLVCMGCMRDYKIHLEGWK